MTQSVRVGSHNMPDLPSDLAKQDALKLAKAEKAIELLQQDHNTLNKKYAKEKKRVVELLEEMR